MSTTRPPDTSPAAIARDAALQRLLATLYREMVADPEPERLKDLLVRGLAQALHLPLVLLARKDESGQLLLIATSDQSRLWSEFHHLPERWDSQVLSGGPGARALREHAPVRVDINDEGFLPWRLAAERDGVSAAQGFPLPLTGSEGVLITFANAHHELDAPGLQAQLEALIEHLQGFFSDLAAHRQQRVLASALQSAGNPAFLTDREGTIVWCNSAFCQFYGYRMEEVCGQNPRFLKSGRQGVRYYRDLWSTIRAGHVWSGDTVDRDHHGVAHTVRQTISPVVTGDRITHFLAVHANISQLKDTLVHDELRLGIDDATGLATRPAFEAACRQMIEAGAGFTLAIVSLRDFRSACAALGPATEQLALGAIAERLRESLGPQAPATQLAAGEYGVLLPLAADAAGAQIEQLREQLGLPLSLREPLPPVDFRAGCARFPEDGKTFDELMRRADQKLADTPIARAHWQTRSH